MSIHQFPKASVIIPTFNEAKFIKKCILSLYGQTYSSLEIVIVDDGSTDNTLKVIERLPKSRKNKMKILKSFHNGPGIARNKGAAIARGKVLVFIDADMTFKEDFIEELIKPILNGDSIGTDSQMEILGNAENFWALCWNMGRFAAAGAINDEFRTFIVPNNQNHGGIFRAILKREFDYVGGFESGGDYTDDESLARKLKKKAILANRAKFFHYNPSSLQEVYQKATWIGSGRNFTKTMGKKTINLLKFFPPVALFKGVLIGIKYNYPKFVFFKIVYDTAIWFAVLKSL